MGHEYDHHSLDHHRHFHRKTIFLPMFCRLSIKDIITLNHGHCKNPISAVSEPSSPKVSCMGQVNRNNRVTGFPSGAGSASISGATHHHRYSKLKRLFSGGKTLLPPTTASGGGVASISAGGGSRIRSRSFRYGGDVRKTKSKNENEQDCVRVVNIGEIDPPLPVVKRVAPPGVGGDEVNLWRRRFNGAAALKGLQIEQVTRLPNSNISSQRPTV
ncbi:hypothetical protein CASFOL_021793 [Castilleja foliolosa]|uniref:Uncharacterized protein n=1 Tax=Castilleja foliolosa TaxID=1961234 RepID=A0ABD3CYV1_9LAMI